MIYLAGASSEVDEIQAWISRLAAAGIPLTHDWTVGVKAAQGAKMPDRDFSRDDRHRFAQQDYDGVRDAAIFWLQVPRASASIGAWVELGIALAAPSMRERRVVVSGDHGRTIFAELADSCFDSHEEAFSRIVVWGKGKR
jgi:hypothetical protein